MRQKGFTLVETLIYIALFAFIIGGSILTSAQLLQGSSQTATKAGIQEEENFVLRKIDWSLSGASSISVPSQTAMTVTRYDGNTVDFRLNASAVEMRESVIGTYLPITTSNVAVNDLKFIYIPVSGTAPAGVTAQIIVNSADASTTKYLRK